MKKQLTLLAILFLATLVFAQSPARNYEFKNGNWYNGDGFSNATWYSTNGLLSKKAPVKIDSVIDLGGRYVVPPMADVFSSSVSENPSVEQQLKMYMNDGIFYVQALTNTREGRSNTEKYANQPNMPDVAFANGALTCSLGYPFVKYEGPAVGIKNSQQWGTRYKEIKASQKMLGNAYWFIDNKEALKANWEKIVAQKPSVISIFLLDAAVNGGKEGKGLSAEMAKLVIKKAKKADLRVFAHVENAEDVRLALKLGVDGLANLPGHDWDGNGDPKRFELTDDDIKKLAKKKIPVSPLFSHAQALGPKPSLQEWHKKTLDRLFAANVNVVTGSDDLSRTTRAELNYWFNLGVSNNAQLLRIFCEQSPRAVFPDRKIGRIADGYEASFLVLDANPLENAMKVRVISFKVKNGVPFK
jgi:hypothetical protein